MKLELTEVELRCLNNTTDGYWQYKAIEQTLHREMPGATREIVQDAIANLVRMGLVASYLFDVKESAYVSASVLTNSNPWFAITELGMEALDDLWPKEWV